MSKETENLKLFKWDTTSETDLNNKFDIEKTLNENWEKLDINAWNIQEELENLRNITNVLPTVSEKGENITLNNTAKNVRFKKFKVSGNAKQETTTQVNYFTGKNIKAGTGNGVGYSFDNSILNLNGTTTGAGDIKSIVTTGISLEAGTYTATAIILSGTYTKPSGKDFAIYIRDKSNNLIFGASGSNFDKSSKVGSTFTIAEKTEVYIQVYSNAKDIVFDNLKVGLQIQKGDTFTQFEQFVLDSPSLVNSAEIKTIQESIKIIIEKSDKTQKQEYIMPVREEMLTDDYLDWDNGEEVHCWNKLVLNGTENDSNFSVESNGEYAVINCLNILENGKKVDENKILCDKLVSKYGDTSNTEHIRNASSNYPNNIVIYIKSSRLEESTVAAFKKYLSTNNIIIYYKTAAETRIAFTDEQKSVAKEIQKATSYEDTTHIYSTDEVSPVFDVEAVIDLKKLIANTSTTAEGEN